MCVLSQFNLHKMQMPQHFQISTQL